MNYNVNLRARPESDAEILLTIPYNTVLSAAGRNLNATWWLVSYDGQTGWVDGQYVAVELPCNELPVR